MAKMGAPTKFNKVVKERIKLVALNGFTDEQMAFLVGVTFQTLNNWKKKHPDFFESLKDWKSTADDEVERSLFERAKGYECPETKPHYSPQAKWVVAHDDENGDFVEGHWEGAWVTLDMTKHYPPETTAAIFWLKNRQPKKWRDGYQLELGDELAKRLAKAWTDGGK